MADRGFDVEDILAHKKVRLNVPPRLDGRPRLPEKDVEKTRRIAQVRIHVERVVLDGLGNMIFSTAPFLRH